MATGRPLFPGGNANDQLIHIFRILGTPTAQIFPGIVDLPEWKDSFPDYKGKDIRKIVPDLSEDGYDLLNVIFFCFSSH